jgi:hypothetical protein
MVRGIDFSKTRRASAAKSRYHHISEAVPDLLVPSPAPRAQQDLSSFRVFAYSTATAYNLSSRIRMR